MNEWEGILKGRETRGIMRLGDKYACFLFWGSSQSLGFSQSSFRHIFSKSIGVKLCCQFSRGVTVLLLSSCNTASGQPHFSLGLEEPGYPPNQEEKVTYETVEAKRSWRLLSPQGFHFGVPP